MPLAQVVHNDVVADQDAELSWLQKSSAVRHKLNMHTDLHPWTGTHRLVGVPRSARQLDLIEVGWWAWKVKNQSRAGFKESEVPRWYVDVSTSVDRHPWGEYPGALTQWSRYYSYQLDKVLDGEDSSKSMQFAGAYSL